MQAGAALGLGATFGVAAALLVAPLAVSADDDAGIYSVIAHDARMRAGADGSRSGYARGSYSSRFAHFYGPVVRSFAPARAARTARVPTGFEASGVAGEGMRPLDRSGAALPHAAPRRAAGFSDAAASRARAADAVQSTRTYCVRLCDGYHFPIGNLASSADLPAHELACQSQCPATPTKLVTIGAGSPDIGEAVARELRRFATAGVALSYRSSYRASCSCQQQTASPARVSPLRDFTLRPGDAVVSGTGARVFAGGAWPFRSNDFADFRAPKAVSPALRAKVDALVGVSRNEKLLKPYSIARLDRSAPRTEVAIVRPPRRDEVRRVDGPRGQRFPAPRILTVAEAPEALAFMPQAVVASAPPASPPQVAVTSAPAPVADAAPAGGSIARSASQPAIINVADAEEMSRETIRARRREVVVTAPSPERPGLRIVATRAAPGFQIVR